MKRRYIVIVVGFLFIGFCTIWWLTTHHRTLPVPVSSTGASPATVIPAPTRADPEGALRLLASTPVGQITGRDAKELADILTKNDGAARRALQRTISSADNLERLLAFRLLLDAEGLSPRLSEIALNDPFVLLRSESADWLYLRRSFADWDAFLAAAAGRPSTDYESLKPTLTRSLLWNDLPAGLEMLGIGRGIDRYLEEYLKRNDGAAAAAQRDLLSGALAPGAQEALIKLLHGANRQDYQEFLRQLLGRTDNDGPARFQGIWLLGQGFASMTTRDLLTAHFTRNPNDPLHSRIAQSLESVDEQMAVGASRLETMEARLSLALRSGNSVDRSATLVAVIDEGLRAPKSVDADLLHRGSEAVGMRAQDYQSKRRIADIEFLRWIKR